MQVVELLVQERPVEHPVYPVIAIVFNQEKDNQLKSDGCQRREWEIGIYSCELQRTKAKGKHHARADDAGNQTTVVACHRGRGTDVHRRKNWIRWTMHGKSRTLKKG